MDSTSSPVVNPAAERSVAVIIPCYKQAHYLAEAIESVLAQTHAHVEIVVVDDGSPDHTAAVAARYGAVRYVHQGNLGLSAARNAGIRESRSPYLVFLDADDRLLPDALSAGLACFDAAPESAMVFGGFYRTRADGSRLGEPVVTNISANHYVEMLARSYISMHATVMLRRAVLDAVGGYDTSLRACEDFDLYLRVAREHQIRGHSAVVAEYRQHASGLSSDKALMLRTALRVLDSQWRHVKGHRRQRAAYAKGRRFWQSFYGLEVMNQARQALTQRRPAAAIGGTATLLRRAPMFVGRRLARSAARRVEEACERAAKAILPDWVARRLRAVRRRSEPLPFGRVALGDLSRVRPVSTMFGFDRGQPVDRYYVEGFLFRSGSDIAGRVLEIADNDYTMRFGGARVTVSDVLHVHDGNPKATIVADLADAPLIPSNQFDCIILTQTLHLIYDVKAALRTAHRILKPGGVLLITSPGITQIDRSAHSTAWYWAFTHDSMQRMLEEVFPAPNVHVEHHGNVFAAVTFLHGLALEEVSTEALDYRDAAYQVIVAARAVKPLTPE